ncbi:MAG: glucose-6-phosphate isomerase [Elusimicrobia bacterium]|nr:glucose-6-phosphate isomerase [Elusimicrobiota bacterium]
MKKPAKKQAVPENSSTRLNEAAAKFARNGINKLNQMRFASRLWEKDGTLWKNDPAHLKIISNSLGWLTVPAFTLEKLPEINAFVESARKKFTDCVVLGMGGSSLAPEVFRSLFPAKKGYPRLHVLDSTDPGWISSLRAKLDISKTLFIYASKSGGTVEPASFFRYFHSEASKELKNPSENFIAVTDNGTGLHKMAQEMKFAKIFVNPSDIGGRFSALSLFGMVPAALAGIDVKTLLERALDMASACGAKKPLDGNPGAALGAAMGAAALSGADKLTLLMPGELSVLGLWIEQLVAESTGKEGKGIAPIANEQPLTPEDYGADRMFVCFSLRNAKNKAAENLSKKLSDRGFPVITVSMRDEKDIAAEYLRWEIATAAAGAVMEIDPFDQPNVQEAKTLTIGVLETFSKQSGEEKQALHEPGLRCSAEAERVLGGQASLSNLAQAISRLAGKNDYLGLLAYLDGSRDTDKALAELRRTLSEQTGAATLFGYGPRYLHSTGQLHKGGANNGVFIILAAAPEKDLQVPGESYTFGQLEKAQALGDFSALDAKGRRALLISLPAPAGESLGLLLDTLNGVNNDAANGGWEMPKAAKKAVKTAKKAVVEAPKHFVLIDFPAMNEATAPGHYAFRITASLCNKVEISIDDQPWIECRNASGHWWHDWYENTPGSHQVVARMHLDNGEVLVSRRRRFKTL